MNGQRLKFELLFVFGVAKWYTPTELHSGFEAVHGNFVMSEKPVHNMYRWCDLSREERSNSEDEPCSGGPQASASQNNMVQTAAVILWHGH